MVAEVLRLRRHSMTFEIGRRCRHHASDAGEPPGDEAGIGRLRNPECDVESLFDQIRKPVVQRQGDGEFAVFAQKLRNRRPYMRDAE